MPFAIRAWLADRAIGRARLELLWDRDLGSHRELRYFWIARAIVVVVTITPHRPEGWQIHAEWPGGRTWTTITEGEPPVA